MFTLLGLLLGLYVAFALVTGEVYARSGIRGRTVSRRNSPEYYWICTAIYAGLAIALATVF